MKIRSGVSLRSSALNTVQRVSLLQDFSEPLVCKSVLSSPKEEGGECKWSPDMFVYGSLVFGKYLQRLGFPRTAVEKCFSSDTRIQSNNLSPEQVSQTCLAQAIHPAGGRPERSSEQPLIRSSRPGHSQPRCGQGGSKISWF